MIPGKSRNNTPVSTAKNSEEDSNISDAPTSAINKDASRVSEFVVIFDKKSKMFRLFIIRVTKTLINLGFYRNNIA